MQAESDIFLGWTHDWPGRGGPRLLHPPAERLEILRADRADAPRTWAPTPDCAGGPSPGPTHAPATASPWPPTSAAPANSTRRSPTSLKNTATRTNATTPRSRPPSKTAEPRRQPTSKTASVPARCAIGTASGRPDLPAAAYAGATGGGKTGRVRTWQHRKRAETQDAGAADNDSCAS
jgi:hypothetical protein